MNVARPPLWQRLRTWLAVRLGRWRGRWSWLALDAAVASWTWWPWPWHRQRWQIALYHPAGLRDDEPAPLVVLLHGCRQEAMGFAQASGWAQAADRDRLRLMCPQQRGDVNPYHCWNWFVPAAQAGRGELDVVVQALERVRTQVACTQVVLAGLSAGGGLAALLAFHEAARWHAVVAVAAPPLLGRANLQDPRQVMRHGVTASLATTTLGLRDCAPLLVVQGQRDETVAPICGEQLLEQGRTVLQRQGTDLDDDARDDGVVVRDGHGVRLQLLRLPDLEHAWTGGPGGHPYAPSGGPPLTAIALAFAARVHAGADAAPLLPADA